jgi:hypothetical protein
VPEAQQAQVPLARDHRLHPVSWLRV